jgi:ubiquinone/menaquinone biosynthesis C-methylase UbiE
MTDRGGGTPDALANATIHHKWVNTYRTAEMQTFYAMAFDEIAKRLEAPRDATILDAGCGSCAKSVLLAARGFRVVATDFSASALELAKETVRAQGFEDRITLQREDLTALSFPDGTFQYVLCWGVLMHIPDLQRALSELVRVLAPGGVLVISEGNMFSVQAVLLRWLKRMLGRERAEVTKTSAGIEYRAVTDQGGLVTRQMDMAWLVGEGKRLGLALNARIAGQFSELYVAVPWRAAKRFIHMVNSVWFRYVGLAGPAFGNILIFEKRSDGGRPGARHAA